MTDDRRQGHWHEWEWNPTRKCWDAFIPLRIYPGEDGKFTVSSSEVWHPGIYDTFEEAERECVEANNLTGSASPDDALAAKRRIEELEAKAPRMEEFPNTVSAAKIWRGVMMKTIDPLQDFVRKEDVLRFADRALLRAKEGT